MANVSKDTPLSEITLRRYEKPGKLSGRDVVRRLCLSLGLLQPGDSRDIIVDIFHVLILAGKAGKALSCTEIEKKVISARNKAKLTQLGIAQSNIRRQLRRMRDIFLVEKIANKYRISEFADISEIFEEKIRKFYLDSIASRVRDYCIQADKI